MSGRTPPQILSCPQEPSSERDFLVVLVTSLSGGVCEHVVPGAGVSLGVTWGGAFRVWGGERGWGNLRDALFGGYQCI